MVTRLWADRATAWTKFWRILKAVFFETASLVGRYLYMFTRKAKEKPQLCVQKFWEAFSPTPCGLAPRPFCPLPCLPQLGQPCEWGPHFRFSCPRSSDKGSALLRPLRWHHHDHARTEACCLLCCQGGPALKVCPASVPPSASKGHGLVFLYKYPARPNCQAPGREAFPSGALAKTAGCWAFLS